MDDLLSCYLSEDMSSALARPNKTPKKAFKVMPKTKEEKVEEENRERQIHDTSLVIIEMIHFTLNDFIVTFRIMQKS